MNIHCLYDLLVGIPALKPHPKNRNKHPEDQIKRLARILEYQGWRYPVKVSKQSGFITSGHGRILAAKLNGWSEVPVNLQDYENEEQEYADVQADNAIASWAELDLAGINADLENLGPDFDIAMLGLKNFMLEPADKYGDQDADAIPENVPTQTKLGDLFQLGPHRLLCGDSTDKAQIERLMNGEKADMVYTDPPYGMNLDADYDSMSKNSTHVKGNAYKNVIGDDEDYDPAHIFKSFPDAKEVFLWGADYFYDKLPPYGSWLVWVKRNENMLEIIGNHFEVCWSKAKNHRKVMYKWWSGVTARNPEFTREHPTEKPISLNAEIIASHSEQGAIIVDIFLGSGSTLIACEKTNRKCFGMEIDPHYCDVIIARWEQFTGLKASRVE